MARIKWEDRKYNCYFTMEGIGKHSKTRPEKDLERRMALLRFKASWKKLELYRKELLARINGGWSGCEGDLDPELREEAILTELRMMLESLRGSVTAQSTGGVKHLLKMIEEIIRLLSRVFRPSFQSLVPCVVGGNISAGGYPRGPPEAASGLTQALNPNASGPGFRIQTGSRKLETVSPLRTVSAHSSKVPDTGFVNMSVGIAIYGPGRVLERIMLGLSGITKRFIDGRGVLASIGPRFGGILTSLGSLKSLGAYLTLGAMLGAASLPGRAEGAAGDLIDTKTFEYTTTHAPWGISWDSTNNRTVWMTQSGELRTGYYNPGSSQVLPSLDANDNWQYLAQEGDCIVMFNDSESRVYIRSATDGTEWGNFTVPNHIDDRGLTMNDNIIYYYIRGPPNNRIEKYNFEGSHLDDMIVPLEIGAANGISINPNDGSFIMNKSTDDKFYVVWFTGTEYDSHQTYSYSTGPGGNKIFSDISFNEQSNTLHNATRDPDNGDAQWEKLYEGPDGVITPTPTPRVITPTPSPSVTPTATPSPTPWGYKTPVPTATPEPTPSRSPSPVPTATPETLETKIGIYRPSSGLWAIRGVTRTYFGGSSDIPLYRDYDGDGTGDIAIFRSSSGLWAIKGVTRTYFGGSSDLPVPTDYDGDGSADIGIFRETSGLWAVRGVTRAYFGGLDDIPVAGDYSGDGSANLAIFRPASGLWAVRGVTRAYFGSSNDTPVPGDYTGDGTRNLAVFRPATGLWAVRGVTRSYFGTSSDQPVPGDYAADGTEEIGIFRPSSGLWAIRGWTRTYFGKVGDVPVAR